MNSERENLMKLLYATSKNFITVIGPKEIVNNCNINDNDDPQQQKKAMSIKDLRFYNTFCPSLRFITGVRVLVTSNQEISELITIIQPYTRRYLMSFHLEIKETQQEEVLINNNSNNNKNNNDEFLNFILSMPSLESLDIVFDYSKEENWKWFCQTVHFLVENGSSSSVGWKFVSAVVETASRGMKAVEKLTTDNYYKFVGVCEVISLFFRIMGTIKLLQTKMFQNGWWDKDGVLTRWIEFLKDFTSLELKFVFKIGSSSFLDLSKKGSASDFPNVKHQEDFDAKRREIEEKGALFSCFEDVSPTFDKICGLILPKKSGESDLEDASTQTQIKFIAAIVKLFFYIHYLKRRNIRLYVRSFDLHLVLVKMIECCISLLKNKEIVATLNNSDRASIIDNLMGCFGQLHNICFLYFAPKEERKYSLFDMHDISAEFEDERAKETAEEKEEDHQEFSSKLPGTFLYENLKVFMEILLEENFAILLSPKWYGQALSFYFVRFLFRLVDTIPASGYCGDDLPNHPLFKYDLIPLFFKLLEKNEYLIVIGCCKMDKSYRASKLHLVLNRLSRTICRLHSNEVMVSFDRIEGSKEVLAGVFEVVQSFAKKPVEFIQGNTLPRMIGDFYQQWNGDEFSLINRVSFMCAALTLDQKWMEIVLEMTREQLHALSELKTQQQPDGAVQQVVKDVQSLQNSIMEKIKQQKESGKRRGREE